MSAQKVTESLGVSSEYSLTIGSRWKDSSPEAYLGATMKDVPNAFLVLGPNVLVYDSFIGLAEAQLDYIIDGLKKVKQKGITRFAIKPQVLPELAGELAEHGRDTGGTPK